MIAFNNDIVYSCGPAGGMFGYLVHKYGKILITNPDGLNWKRAKWNKLIQTGFRTFEYLATKFSDYIACDSYGIEQHIQESYNTKKTFVAEYGAYPNNYLMKEDEAIHSILKKYGILKNAYHLVVSRLEPENHVHIIINGYVQKKRKYPLLIVGNLSDTKYINSLKSISNNDVLFVGGIYNKVELEVVRANALDYLHGHSVGGTNPSLLEAMASKNLCVCHDNKFNREVVNENGLFFKNESNINTYIEEIEENSKKFDKMREGVFNKIMSYYTWDAITAKYNNSFQTIVKGK
jgi:rhamnosyltransferase